MSVDLFAPLFKVEMIEKPKPKVLKPKTPPNFIFY